MKQLELLNKITGEMLRCKVSYFRKALNCFKSMSFDSIESTNYKPTTFYLNQVGLCGTYEDEYMKISIF